MSLSFGTRFEHPSNNCNLAVSDHLFLHVKHFIRGKNITVQKWLLSEAVTFQDEGIQNFAPSLLTKRRPDDRLALSQSCMGKLKNVSNVKTTVQICFYHRRELDMTNLLPDYDTF